MHESSGTGQTSEAEPDELVGRPLGPGTLVGRYVVLSKLGEGAMGEVFAAYDPELDRKVAIKLLARGRPAGARARLRREAQALAKLEHPNVVAVHDVGVHEGQLFIGMEFVEGQTLQAWLAAVAQPRPWREVVRVFEAAGRGLAAAHAVNLVHRDFKPANVMIGSEGRVRVMDFGLARTDEETSSEGGSGGSSGSGVPAQLDALTQDGTIMGTPAYMPLEQFQGEVDARSDQFSFCVTLYEALYGERPFEGDELLALMSALADAQIREPPRGTKVPGWLRKVVLRGLAPERDDRWPSMPALLAALTDDPALRRRRWSLGLLGVGVVAAAVATTLYVIEGDEASPCTALDERLAGVWDDARREQVRAAITGTGSSYADDTWTRVERGLDAYAHAWVGERVAACEATQRGEQSGELLDLRMACLDERLSHVHATVELLSEADAALVAEAVKMVANLPGLERCADVEALRASQPPPDDPVVAEQVEQLEQRRIEVLALEHAGRYAQALELADALAGEADVLDYEPLLVRAWLRQAALHERLGEYERAEPLLVRAYDVAVGRRMASESAQAARHTMSVLREQARFDEARSWARHAEPLARADTREAVATFLLELAALADAEGKYEEAQGHAERGLAIRVEVLGSEHPEVAAALTDLGKIALHLGRFDESVAHHERALAIKQRTLGPTHPDVATSLNYLGNVALDRGQPELAYDYHRRALELRERALGPEHRDVAASLNNLGNAAGDLGHIDEAIEHHRRALSIKEKVFGPEHPQVANSLNNLATLAVSKWQFDQALAYHERALAIRERTLGPDHPDVATSLSNLGDLECGFERYAAARDHFERSLTILERSLEPDHPYLVHPLLGLGKALLGLGQPVRAIEVLERADRLWRTNEDEDSRAYIHFTLARALWDAPIAGGRDRPRARSLAAQAREHFARSEATRDVLDEVDAWLAEIE